MDLTFGQPAWDPFRYVKPSTTPIDTASYTYTVSQPKAYKGPPNYWTRNEPGKGVSLPTQESEVTAGKHYIVKGKEVIGYEGGLPGQEQSVLYRQPSFMSPAGQTWYYTNDAGFVTGYIGGLTEQSVMLKKPVTVQEFQRMMNPYPSVSELMDMGKTKPSTNIVIFNPQMPEEGSYPDISRANIQTGTSIVQPDYIKFFKTENVDFLKFQEQYALKEYRKLPVWEQIVWRYEALGRGRGFEYLASEFMTGGDKGSLLGSAEKTPELIAAETYIEYRDIEIRTGKPMWQTSVERLPEFFTGSPPGVLATAYFGGYGIGEVTKRVVPTLAGEYPFVASALTFMAKHPNLVKTIGYTGTTIFELQKVKAMAEAHERPELIAASVGKDVTFITGFQLGFEESMAGTWKQFGHKPILKEQIVEPKVLSGEVEFPRPSHPKAVKELMAEIESGRWNLEPGTEPTLDTKVILEHPIEVGKPMPEIKEYLPDLMVYHATTAPFPRLAHPKVGPFGDPFLFAAPSTSIHFLGLPNLPESSELVKNTFTMDPSILAIKLQGLERIPPEIRAQGLEAMNQFMSTGAEQGVAYPTPKFELGKMEKEVGIGVETALKRTFEDTTWWQKITGFKYYTEIYGNIVPIYQYTALPDVNSVTPDVISLGQATNKIFLSYPTSISYQPSSLFASFVPSLISSRPSVSSPTPSFSLPSSISYVSKPSQPVSIPRYYAKSTPSSSIPFSVPRSVPRYVPYSRPSVSPSPSSPSVSISPPSVSPPVPSPRIFPPYPEPPYGRPRPMPRFMSKRATSEKVSMKISKFRGKIGQRPLMDLASINIAVAKFGTAKTPYMNPKELARFESKWSRSGTAELYPPKELMKKGKGVKMI